jgi:hypothetical protein
MAPELDLEGKILSDLISTITRSVLACLILFFFFFLLLFE